MIYLIGCKCFSDVTDHAIYLFVETANGKLAYLQVHYGEPLMPFARCLHAQVI